MAEMKPGTRLKSVVCSGEAMVVKAPEGDLVLTCGGVPMSTEAEVTVDASQANEEHMYRLSNRQTLCQRRRDY